MIKNKSLCQSVGKFYCHTYGLGSGMGMRRIYGRTRLEILGGKHCNGFSCIGIWSKKAGIYTAALRQRVAKRKNVRLIPGKRGSVMLSVKTGGRHPSWTEPTPAIWVSFGKILSAMNTSRTTSDWDVGVCVRKKDLFEKDVFESEYGVVHIRCGRKEAGRIKRSVGWERIARLSI